MKVYVELATITAGETDAEIDQVYHFHDAVMGYSSLIYSLPPRAGFKDFMKCAEQVFETQCRDERLPDKLVCSSQPSASLRECRVRMVEPVLLPRENPPGCWAG